MMNLKHIKETWDVAVAMIGASFHYAIQSVEVIRVESFINIIVGISVIIFALIRSYYWIKHDGYSDETKN